MFDAFLKVDGIPGESKDDKHKDWIEIIDFVHGVNQPYSMTASSAGGATAERADFGTFNVSKLVDRASPKLWEACFTGKHIKEVVIELFRAGGKEFPSETISFVPAKITMDYTQQSRADGTPAGHILAGWNLMTNAVA